MKLGFARIVLALALTLGLASCGPSGSDRATHSSDQSGDTSGAPATDTSQTQFDTAEDAQKRCPTDTVVWVNTASGIYHMPGQRWYGNTESGTYMCQQDADAAGDRETRNGQ